MSTEQSAPTDAVEGVVKEKKVVPPKPADIVVREGSLQPATASELMRTIANFAQGGAFPECFKTPQQQLAAYNLGNSLCKKDWQLAVNHMAFIEGKLAIYGELPTFVVEQTGEVAEKRVFLINKDYVELSMANKNMLDEVFAAVMQIQRKGRMMKEFFYTMEDAKKAGQYPPMKNEWIDNKKTGRKIPNESSPWFAHFKTMLMRKVQALGYKFEFGDALLGVPIAEYDFDEAPDLVPMKDVSEEVSEKTNRVRDLNSRFSDDTGPAEAVQ